MKDKVDDMTVQFLESHFLHNVLCIEEHDSADQHVFKSVHGHKYF